MVVAPSSILDLFSEKDVVRICAPMVRYSKLSFRALVRKYNCDLAYTPMIISDAFVKSQEARDVEFTTNNADRPLIVQFAAANATDLANATEMIKPYADGVGINCGCPQRWAMAEGIGAHLIKHPDLICDMIKQTKQRVGNEFPCSIKIRVHPDLRKTVDMCQKAEHAGAAWIDVHGRTIQQRRDPVDYDAIKLIKDSVRVPVVANGDIKCEKDVAMVKERTNVDGVMAAQGLLDNPAMYAGYSVTPKHCVEDYMDIAFQLGTPFVTFHHHLIFMTERWHSKAERRVFNNLSSTAAVVDYLDRFFDIRYGAS